MTNNKVFKSTLMNEPLVLQIDFRLKQLEHVYANDNKTVWIAALLAHQHTGHTKLNEHLIRHLDNLVLTYGDVYNQYLRDVYPIHFKKVG